MVNLGPLGNLARLVNESIPERKGNRYFFAPEGGKPYILRGFQSKTQANEWLEGVTDGSNRARYEWRVGWYVKLWDVGVVTLVKRNGAKIK